MYNQCIIIYTVYKNVLKKNLIERMCFEKSILYIGTLHKRCEQPKNNHFFLLPIKNIRKNRLFHIEKKLKYIFHSLVYLHIIYDAAARIPRNH